MRYESKKQVAGKQKKQMKVAGGLPSHRRSSTRLLEFALCSPFRSMVGLPAWVHHGVGCSPKGNVTSSGCSVHQTCDPCLLWSSCLTMCVLDSAPRMEFPGLSFDPSLKLQDEIWCKLGVHVPRNRVTGRDCRRIRAASPPRSKEHGRRQR